jgi:hydrophobic/amphiphilic exporter-1 (mainly G- bacteria), HAE1 family
MKLSEVSIRRPVLATVMVATLAVFGLVAWPKIGVDLFPSIEFPIALVTAVYPGADPETIETKVNDKLEEAIGTVSGIKTLKSTAMENVGIVVVQFELERKADEAVQDVRDKVAGAVRELPKDLQAPVIEKFDPGATPVLAVVVAGQKSTRELTHVADKQVREKLQTLSGVGGVDLVGGQDREFHVYLDPNKLESMYLSVMDVVQALGAQNVEIPGGRMDVGTQELSVKTRGQVHSAREIGNIVITAAGGAPVRIRDIARIEDGVEEKRSHSELSGRSAVALIVRKQSGSNMVEVAHTVKQAIKDLEKRVPAGVTLAIPMDNSLFIERVIDDVKVDVGLGALLAVLIIMLFLHNWRATLISALAIPTSLIATVAFIQAMGYTFNMLTMLAVSLSIGILVDDAIVVIENIHRHLEMGKPPMKAAADATNEIGLAVMATTAAIICVFVPVATMKGIIGRFFVQFGLTVAFAVAVSLFVAFTLTPMLASRMLKEGVEKTNFLSRGLERGLKRLDAGYRVLLRGALNHRLLTLGIAVGVLVASFGMARFLKLEFMPEMDSSQFMVKVELPTGASLDATSRYVREVSTRIRQVPGVTDTFATVAAGTQGEVNVADIQVNLISSKKRTFSQKQGMNYMRHLLAEEKDVKIAVEPVNLMGGGGASAMRQSAVQFNLRGADYAELNRSAEQLMQVLKDKGGYVDLDTTYRGGKPEVVVNIDRDRAADLGVPIASIAMAVRFLVGGDKATDIQADGERFDVRVRLDEQFRKRSQDLLNLKVRSTNPGPYGTPPPLVHLANVVTVDTGTGPGKIERQNRRRQVTILANLEGKVMGDAHGEVDAAAAAVVPKHIETGWTGQGDFMMESFGHAVSALILAILLVYLILAAQFESFLHPFTIMLSLPFSLIGAFGGLLIARQTMSMGTMIGIIMLMGLVVKNAILLVDYTNTLRDRGMERNEALLTAGPVRLRPILMTTLAMIFGMLPVAMALSEGSEFRAPMATVVIGGLITSTILTLVVVPVAYSLLDALSERVMGKRKMLHTIDDATVPAAAHAAEHERRSADGAN